MRFKDLSPDEFRANVQDGLSDTELARRYGVSTKTISRWRAAFGLASRWEPSRLGHGTVAEYARGCRCEPCTEANRESHARTVARMKAKGLPEGDPRHGRYATYQSWGCRCVPCAAAASQRNRAYLLRRNPNSRNVPRWSDREDAIIRAHSPAEAARLTGRTLNAVYQHRKFLGITDRRTR